VNANTSPTDATTAAVSTNATNIQARTRTCWTEQDKAECLALFGQSGVTAAEFCRQLGISAATFSLWRRKARSDDTPAGESGPHFAQVCLTEATPGVSTPQAAAPPVVVIRLPGGARLEALPGTDPVWLAQLLKSLAST
jgi:transposase-like protein